MLHQFIIKNIYSFTFTILSFSCYSQDFYGMVKVDENLWVDQTEITNNEYRQFVQFVRDSICRSILDGEGLLSRIDPKYEQGLTHREWKKIRKDPVIIQKLREAELLYPKDYFDDSVHIDCRSLNYSYCSGDTHNKIVVNIYPDTLVWMRPNLWHPDSVMMQKQSEDGWFTGSSWSDYYFWHPAWDDYPVVGVSYQQALAFCHWRSRLKNSYLQEKGLSKVIFTLPSYNDLIKVSLASSTLRLHCGPLYDHFWVTESNEMGELNNVEVAFRQASFRDTVWSAIRPNLDKIDSATFFKEFFWGGYLDPDPWSVLHRCNEAESEYREALLKYLKIKSKSKYCDDSRKFVYHPTYFPKYIHFNADPFNENGYGLGFPQKVTNSYGTPSMFADGRTNLIYDLSGNVAEMLSDGRVVGGSYRHSLENCRMGSLMVWDANEPTAWMGFRCVAYYIKQ